MNIQELRLKHEKMCSPVFFISDNSAATKENRNLTSITVNRLLKKLQTAIANGQHHEAANIARDLARLKVNCNMTRQDTPDMQAPATVDDIQNIR